MKNGLPFSIPPRKLNRTDILTTFNNINLCLQHEIKPDESSNALKASLSELANNYYSRYKPTHSTIKKHGILKKLKENENIAILKPDKGNAVVIMDKAAYNEKLYGALSDNTKLKKLK